MGLLTFRNLQMSQAGVYSSGGPTPPASPPGFGQVYNTSAQNIANGATITFDSNGPLLNITHVAGSDTITINATGTYLITWVVSAQGDGGAYTLLQNGVAISTLSYVTDPGNGETVGNGIVNLSSGDTVQLRNNTGLLLALQTQAGFVNASITFEKMISSGASSGTTTLVGNIGSATEVGGIINVVTANTTAKEVGAGNTLTLDFGLSNLGIGSSYPSLIGGSQNTSLGDLALHSVTAGVSNTAVGYNTMALVTSGQANTAVGEGAGTGLTTQNHNTAIGATALEQAACADATAVGSNALGILTSGDQNTAIGSGALSALGTGANNIALGFDAGVNLTTNESSTILIGNAGVVLDNNTVRIGTQGAGAGQQNKSFMAGIRGTTSGSTDRYPVNIDVNGQFDGSGNVYLPTTSSSIGKIVQNGVDFIHTFGSDNLFIGTPTAKAGNYTLTGTDNIAIGANVMQNLTLGSLNFGIGTNTLNALTSGQNNVGYGIACLQGITISNQNLAIGNNSTRYTTGSNNIGIGYQAYQGAVGTTTGSSNICIGTQAGSAYIGAETNNIIIGSTLAGTAAESNVTRIGNGQTKCFVAGIDGVNVGSVATVVTEASNQLGTAVITAGTGISVTAGANTITITNTVTGLAWSVIAANQTAAVNNGYFCNKAGTLALALPATSAVGDVIEVTNENTATGVQFTQAAGQQILLPNNTTTTLGATGTLTSSAVGDTIKLVCKTANTVWRCTSMNGNWTPA